MGIVEAWERWSDGEITLGDLGEALLDEGYSPREVREMLSDEVRYRIPVNYFGAEGRPNDH